MSSGKILSGGGAVEAPLAVAVPMESAAALNQNAIVANYMSTQNAVDSPIVQFWHVMLKRRWTVIACFVIVVTLAAIASFKMTPLYMASAQMAINRENSEFLGFKNLQQSNGEDSETSTTLDTQVRILKSDTIALQVIHRLELDKNPIFNPPSKKKQATGTPALSGMDTAEENALLERFEKGLSVAVMPGTRIIEIRFMSPNPKLAAEIVNAVTASYIEQNFKTHFDSMMQTSDWLQKQLADLKTKVEASQEKLVRYQKENGILGIDEKQNIITEKLQQLNSAVTQAEAIRIDKESAFRAATGEGPPVPGSNLEKYYGQAGDLRTQLAQVQTTFGPSYPKVLELKNQLKQVEDSIKEERLRDGTKQKAEYESALRREKLLRASFEAQKGEANKLNEKSVDYTILKRDLETNRQLYEGLLQRLKEASVSAGLKSSNISVVDPARVPETPSKPDKRRNMTLAAIVGLLGGIALAFVLEQLDTTVRNPEQVGVACQLPLLAVIPSSTAISGWASKTRRLRGATDKPQSGSEMIATLKPHSQIAEAYRALRTSILLSGFGQAPKLIMVTSALPQEGKTTTSLNAAMALAQQGCRVLLIDADMRRPSIHRRLGLNSLIGLSSLLSSKTTAIKDAIQPMPNVANMHIMPAGPLPPHPSELLGSPRLKEILDTLREDYDHVIIDTPPVVSVTDAVVLSIAMDAIIIVARSGSTSRNALRRCREILSSVNARVTGVVLNDVDLRSPDSYYYSYYGAYAGGYTQNQETEAEKH